MPQTTANPLFSSLPRWILALLLLAVTTGSMLHAQQIQVKNPDQYSLFGTFYLEVDGVEDKGARLYHNPTNRGILVRSTVIEAPFQVMPSTRQVEIFKPTDLIDQPDGAVQLAVDKPASAQPFTLEDGVPRFNIEGKLARIKAKPPLLGPHLAKDLTSYNAAYATKAKLYQPQAGYVDQLKAVEDNVHVKIYFGTWCSVCSELMPHILKVEEALAGSKITFEYYGVPQGYGDEESKRLSINSLPTGFIYKNGEEVGRVESHGWRFPSLAIVNTLNGATARAKALQNQKN
jgi:thiol-disulfide isomerase/thioredoxin